MISRLKKTPIMWDLRRPFHLRLAAVDSDDDDIVEPVMDDNYIVEPVMDENGIGCGFLLLLVIIAVFVLWFFGYGTYCAFANAQFLSDANVYVDEHKNLFLIGLVLQTLWWVPVPFLNFLLVIAGTILQIIGKKKFIS